MKNSIKELTEGMQRLCAVANRIVAADAAVERIEVDLLMEDLRRLYDVALVLQAELPEVKPSPAKPHNVHSIPDDGLLSSTMMATMAAMAPAPVVETAPKEEPAEEPAEEEAFVPDIEVNEQPRMQDLEEDDNSLLFDEVIIEPAPAPEPEPVVVPEPEPVVVPEPEPVVVPEPEPVVAPEPEPVVVPEPEPVVEPKVEPRGQASLLDYLKYQVEETPTVKTLGDALTGAAAQRVAANHDQLVKKVDDLRTVININDKFSFMSELFHNNMKAYNDFIMQLNGIAGRDEALSRVQEVAKQYGWDDNSVVVKTFYTIFDKKF